MPAAGPQQQQQQAWYGMPDEFSWLDLQAVGELVSGQQEAPGFGNGIEGYGYMQFMGRSSGEEWGHLGVSAGDDINRFF